MADAETEREARIDLLAQLLGDRLQPQRRDLDAHHAELTGDDELISAKASLHIRVAEIRGNHLPGLGQVFRSNIVPQGVVDLLLSFEVYEQHREGHLGALRNSESLLCEEIKA